MKRNSTLVFFLLTIVATSQAFAENHSSTHPLQADVLRQQKVDNEVPLEKNARRPDISAKEREVKDKTAKLSRKAAEVSKKKNSSLDEAVRKKQEADMARNKTNK